MRCGPLWLLLLLLLAAAPVRGVEWRGVGYVASGAGRGDMLIVGFLPYWTISGYSLPGHVDVVVFFDAPVSSDGSIDTQYIDYYWSDIERINNTCGCILYVALTCFSPSDMDLLLAYHRDDFVGNVTWLVENYGFPGVNIDFEFMRDTNSYTGGDNTEYLLEVLAELRGRGINVSLDVAGSVEAVYRDSRLAQYLDFVFLMGYDYHWSTAPTTGPVSPLLSSELDVDDSLDILDDYYPREKIVLGLPLYGYDWPASGPDPYTSTTGAGTARRLESIMNYYADYGVLWDDTGHVPWIRYVSNDEWRQIWFDNTTSLAMKIDYVVTRGYGGYGFWALGYEDGFSGSALLWEMIWSREKPPVLDTLNITYAGNGTYMVIAEGLVNTEELTINISFDEPLVNASITYGGLGLSYDERTMETIGDTIVIHLKKNLFPGIGVTGTGLIANITIEPETPVRNVTVTGGSARIVPGEETLEPLTVNSIIVNQPLPNIPEPGHMLSFAAAATVMALFTLLLKRRRT